VRRDAPLSDCYFHTMSNYRRSREGHLFFFTVVAHKRRQILTTPMGRECLRNAIKEVQDHHPFELTAIVLLPDHLHTIWEMPRGDQNYSLRWRRIKSLFTTKWITAGGKAAAVSHNRVKRRERGVWQRRFYEHTIQDEADLKRCVDYLHVNPLKHGFVKRVCDWPWSSFHRYVKLGEYSANWGSQAEWYGDEFKNFD